MNAAFFALPESRRITDRIPLGRVGQVDDLDGAILFLASQASLCYRIGRRRRWRPPPILHTTPSPRRTATDD
jgi:hypothetical protein